MKYVRLNEGLEQLGEKERVGNDELEGQVFSRSGIETIRIPSTLKEVKTATFFQCKMLKSVEFSEGLEKIDEAAFQETAVENVVLPSTLRTVSQGTFALCKQLRSVVINEGLEVLGTDTYLNNGELYHGIFDNSGLRSIKLPSTLKRIEYEAFRYCGDLTEIQLPDGLEVIGRQVFFKCGLQEIRLPRTLREIGEQALWSASLQTVWVDDGCAVDFKDWSKYSTAVVLFYNTRDSVSQSE